MDAARLTVTFAVLMIGYGLGRFVLDTLGRAGDGMATLFVAPDRAPGWPRGVQERDEPWDWRVASRPDPNWSATDDAELEDPGARPSGSGGTAPSAGSYIVPVEPVAPVRLIVRPH